MYYIDHTLLAKLPEDVQKIITEEGEPISDEEYKERYGKEMPETLKPDITAPDEMMRAKTPDEERQEMATEGFRLPKAEKYGEEMEYEDKFDGNGRMMDYSDKKKNEIKDFKSATDRGMALFGMAEKQEMMKKKPEKKDKFKAA